MIICVPWDGRKRMSNFELQHGMTEDEFEGLCDAEFMGFSGGLWGCACETCKNRSPFGYNCTLCTDCAVNWEPSADLWDGLEGEE